jgi:hypothetical protein
LNCARVVRVAPVSNATAFVTSHKPAGLRDYGATAPLVEYALGEPGVALP